LWPKDLNHYISCHGVRIPQEFIDHIRARHYQLPSAAEVAEIVIDRLPWP
jgi:hypothetical protein